MDKGTNITRLLRDWKNGDDLAEEALIELIYDDLHNRARRLMELERAGHTIQPTALVHEAYLQLRGARIDWVDRVHFYALSARLMRRLLVNHAKARAAQKRGGGDIRVTLTDGLADAGGDEADFVDLADALEALRAIDPDKAELIELQYFGGLSVAEIEEVTGQSVATIGRHLRFARAWLRNCMENGGDLGNGGA